MSIKPYPQIICLGDSITQGSWAPGGWCQQLAADYSHALDVVNRGMGGYTSRQLLRKLKEDMIIKSEHTAEVRLILLAIGTNDSVVHGIQHVPIEEYRSNLTSIISLLRSTFPSAHLLLLTPTILSASRWESTKLAWGEPPSDQGKERTEANQKAFVDACLEVGQSEGVVCVDQDKGMREGLGDGDLESVLTDGLHLTSKGYSILYKPIREAIDVHFPELIPDATPRAFEEWRTYDM